MKRKSFILLITLILISLTSVCFANDMSNDVKNGLNGATNTIVDGTANLAEDIRSGIGNAENNIENGVNSIGGAVMGETQNTRNNFDTGYSATRTAAEDTSIINSTTATTWTWIAVTIAAFVIVALVWYYAKEHTRMH